MTATKKKLASSAALLRKAERDLEAARKRHRQAFRKALLDLCNEFGFRLEASGSEGADIDLLETNGPVRLEDIPE